MVQETNKPSDIVDQSTDAHDPARVARAVRNICNMGYHCLPVQGQAWWSTPDKVIKDVVERGLPAIERLYRERGEEAGIGMICGTSTHPEWKLIGVDIDTDDKRLISMVSTLLTSSAPCKFGSKGLTFFAKARRGLPAINHITNARGLPEYKFVHADSIDFKWAKGYVLPSGKPKDAEIEILGISAYENCVVPPSIHPKTHRMYQWVPFPGSSHVGTLEDTPIEGLPEINEVFLLLLVNYADNPNSKLWEFIGQTSEGDYHDKMRDAVFYLYHQRFTEDEVIAICMAESSLSTDDDAKTCEREQAVRKAYHGVRTKYPVPNTAEPRGTRKPKADRADRVPDDRLIANWMAQRYEDANTFYFNGVPYTWSEIDKRWDPIVDVMHPRNPWVEVNREISRLFPAVGSTSIKQGVTWFESSMRSITPSPNYRLIPFANGVLDVTTNEFRPEEREDYIPVRLNVNYDPQATAPRWREFIYNLMVPPADAHSQHTEEDDDHLKAINVLEEYLGYCLVRSHRFRVMLFLIGKTSTGKSTLLKVIQKLLPAGQVSNVGMEQMNEPNHLRMMINANINIASEVGRHAKDVDATLLKITSGEAVPVKVLYQDAGSSVVAARMIFHGNLSPDTTDSTGAIAKRMLLLRTTDILPREVIPDYHEKLLEEAPGIINALVKAYARLLARNKFDLPRYSDIATQEITGEANSVSHWAADQTTPADDYKNGTSSDELYQSYRDWAENNGYKPFNVAQWSKQLVAMGFGPSNARVKIGGEDRIIKKRRLVLMNPVRVPY